MLSIIIHWLKDIPKEYLVVIVGALPISELRGAIPLAFAFGMPIFKSFLLGVLGNIIFVAPALYLFEPISERLRKFKFCSRFFTWFSARTLKKADSIQKYQALGLAIFVAVPLPMTGAYSGVIAASLFKIRFRYAFCAISAGVICAGIIVSILCLLGKIGCELML